MFEFVPFIKDESCHAMGFTEFDTPSEPEFLTRRTLKSMLGFARLSKEEQVLITQANMRGGTALAIITCVIELYMLGRSFLYVALPAVVARVGQAWIIQHRVAYIVQLASAALFLAGAFYDRFKWPLGLRTLNVFLMQFMAVSLAFGVFIACGDITRDHGMYSLLTQIMAIACIFSIRPCIFFPTSVLALGLTINFAITQGSFSHSEAVNLFIFLLIAVVSCCIRYYTAVRHAQDHILLQEEARYDGLTGLGNLHMLRLDLPGFVGHQINVSILDINNLKLCNDRLGHGVGNASLVLLAEVLRARFGNLGVCYRIGGDEFAVISVDLPHTQHVLLAKEVEGLFQTRSQDEGILIDGEPLSVSVGTVHGIAGSTADIDGFLQLADQSMYRIKQRNKAARTSNAEGRLSA